MVKLTDLVGKTIEDVVPSLIEKSPVIGSVYGFSRTAIRVYEAQTPTGAVCSAVRGVLVDCTPPNVKYPLLCGYLLTSGVLTYCTGANPIAGANCVNAARLILEQMVEEV